MDDPIRESGPHLAGILDQALTGDGPLYRQLADGLKRAVDRGEIPLGTVLPPERVLARSLSVSRATVVAAYDRLKNEGWLESRQGSGTWVRRPEGEDRGGVDAVATARLFLSDDKADQRTGPGEPPMPDDEDLIDLSVAAVTGSPMVVDILTSLSPDDVSSLVAHHGYVPHGLRALREIVAARFTVAGLPSSEDQILATTGAHQGISLVARQTLQRGDTVLVESPTFPGALDVFRRFGARMVPLPVDGHGARTEVLPDLLARTEPKLVYVSPNFHNPTGTVLPEQRRRVLAELADRTGIVVLEDLAMGDVDLDAAPLPPPIAAFSDGTGAIHTLGSTAKLFWAGLRVGWLRSPASWTVRMLATKTVADLGTPLLSQLLAVRLLEHADQVLADRRAELLPQRDLLADLLTEHLPQWQWQLPSGGLSLWVTLPAGNAEEFAELALRHGVSVVPGPALSVDEGNRRGLRLVFSRPEPVLREGVRRLAAAWQAYEPIASRAPTRLLV
ncbi:MocR-like transcription factor YczR [Egicoccus halophilus]|uniref:DNA-binding transcriptional regulator n=1 Tax=Egicoccus halophilus TaxID=1670830 RepID=A0A8J3ACX7_9ACTN|nr:PLP-dependent aminotransferase family protein [Egicoccus halophilus]GGI08883.1 DNA-binding transcriptional regulator [Egicoccus halophilus]